MHDFPAIYGQPVTEAHVKLCQERGHATMTVDGTTTEVCPRCGNVAITYQLAVAAELVSEAHDKLGEAIDILVAAGYAKEAEGLAMSAGILATDLQILSSVRGRARSERNLRSV